MLKVKVRRKIRPTMVVPIAVGESKARRSSWEAAKGDARHCGHAPAVLRMLSFPAFCPRNAAVWAMLALVRSGLTAARIAGTTLELVVIWLRAER